jgi:hypothetical protein
MRKMNQRDILSTQSHIFCAHTSAAFISHIWPHSIYEYRTYNYTRDFLHSPSLTNNSLSNALYDAYTYNTDSFGDERVLLCRMYGPLTHDSSRVMNIRDIDSLKVRGSFSYPSQHPDYGVFGLVPNALLSATVRNARTRYTNEYIKVFLCRR